MSKTTKPKTIGTQQSSDIVQPPASIFNDTIGPGMHSADAGHAATDTRLHEEARLQEAYWRAIEAGVQSSKRENGAATAHERDLYSVNGQRNIEAALTETDGEVCLNETQSHAQLNDYQNKNEERAIAGQIDPSVLPLKSATPRQSIDHLQRQQQLHESAAQSDTRRRSKLVAEAVAVCEPTIEKAVQSIQILPAERPKPQYVYISDHEGKLIEIDRSQLEMLRTAVTPAAEVTKRLAKDVNARDNCSEARGNGNGVGQSATGEEDDDQSQNETKSQITQFTDNTGANQYCYFPSQQFQMNQVRCFQNMNAAESQSQLNSSDKSPQATSLPPAQAPNLHPGRNLAPFPSHNTQDQPSSAHQPQPSTQSAASNLPPHALVHADSPCMAAPAPPRSTRLSTHLHALNSQYTAATAILSSSHQQQSHDRRQEGGEPVENDDSGGEGARRRRGDKEEGERPCWLTFSNNVFDIVAEKQRTASFTQSLKSAEMESAGAGKELAVPASGEEPSDLTGTQQAAQQQSVTRSKKARDLMNADRMGSLVNGRPKSSQLGRTGFAAQQRGKMIGAQRNNMKSTREESGAMAHAQGSSIRSTQQLSSAGASLRSPQFDAGTESNPGSAQLKKRRELGLGAASSSSIQRKPAQSYNQASQMIASRKAPHASSPLPMELPYKSNEKTESRSRVAYTGQQSHAAMRSQPRKTDQGETQLASTLANPSIISHQRRSSAHRLLAENSAEVSGAIGSRERRQETEKGELDTLEEPQEDQPPKIGEDEMRKEMIAAFQKMRLDVYSDILRIKKPQNQALMAAQLLCRLVCAFRGGAQRQVADTKFPEWSQIQEFVHKKPNVIKFNQEITQLIQHMILSRDYVVQVKSDQLKNHLSKMTKLHQQYFGQKTKTQVLRPFQTNKNFSQIVNLCYCIVRYVLFQAGREDLLNLTVEPPPGQGGRARSRRLRQEREQSDRDMSLGSHQSHGRQASLGKPAYVPQSAATSAYKQARDRSTGTSLERGTQRQGQSVSSKKQTTGQSRNVAAALGSSREASRSTALSAKANSFHQLCFGMTKKRSPRQTLPSREQDKANAVHDQILSKRTSTPKQEQHQPQPHVGNSSVYMGHKSQQQPSAPGKSSVQRTSNQQQQKSTEYPQKRVAYARALEYEDEVKRRLNITTSKHTENSTGGGVSSAFRASGTAGRQSKKARQANRQEVHAANQSRSHRAGGGTFTEKQRSAGSRKKGAAGDTSLSSQNRLSFKADSLSASFTKPSQQHHDHRQQPPRLSSPHEAYQQPKDRQIQTQTHSNYRYHSKATEKSAGEASSVQNAWVNVLKRKGSQTDGHLSKAGSAHRKTGSAFKSYLKMTQIDEKQHVHVAPLHEPDLATRGNSPLLVSQKKSKKVYEIMLQQQRRKSNNRFEQLTLSSVQKSKKGFNPVGEFSGRKATVPAVQTFGATSSTPGLASTLYNSHVFASNVSRQNGKEAHHQVRIAADKAEEQRSESKPSLHDKLALGLSSRMERAQGLINGIAKSVLSPQGSRASPEKGSVKRHRPSACAVLSPSAAFAAPHLRKKLNTISRDDSDRPQARTVTPKHHKGMSKSRIESQINQLIEQANEAAPVNDLGVPAELLQRTMVSNVPEQPIESDPSLVASGSVKPRKSRLERSLSKSNRRRDRLQRLRPAPTAPHLNPDLSYSLDHGDEQLRQFLALEGECTTKGEVQDGIETQRIDQPGTRRSDLNDSRQPEAADSTANMTQLFYAVTQPSEHLDYAGITPVFQEDKRDSSQNTSHLSSLIQQIQPLPPAPTSQPLQPDQQSPRLAHDELDRMLPIEQAAEAPCGNNEASIMILEQGIAKPGNLTRNSNRELYNIPESTSPLNYKATCKDSDELSNLSQVEGNIDDDGAAIPAVLPQSSSRESGRISELKESKSTGRSQVERKDEHALSSESLLSEDQIEGTEAPKSLKDSSRVHEYKLTERSEGYKEEAVCEQPYQVREEQDPFEEAKRIAAMIKAECLDQAVSIQHQKSQIVNGTIDDSDQKQQIHNASSSVFRCTPPNELSARNLLQKERMKTAYPDYQMNQMYPRDRRAEPVEKMMMPEQSSTQRHAFRPVNHQESTWTISTPMRPAREHPRDLLSPSSKGTPATYRHAAPALAPRASQPDNHSTTQNRRPDLVIAAALQTGRRPEYGQPEPATATTAQNDREDEFAGKPSIGAHLHSFLEYCGRSMEPRDGQGALKVDQVITHSGHMQRVDLGGGEDEEDDGVVCTGRETLSGREPGSPGKQSAGNLSKLSEEALNDKPESIHQESNKVVEPDDLLENSMHKQQIETVQKLRADQIEELDEAAYKSKSAGSEDGYYMQEIVSPFRQLKLSALGSGGAAGCDDASDNLEEQHRQIASTQWMVNPVKVRRRPEDNEDDGFMNQGMFDEDEEQSDLQGRMPHGRRSSPNHQLLSFAKQKSHGGNPYIQQHDMDRTDLALEKRISSPVVISPGKMKEHITMSRSGIMEQIIATQQRIEENSPSQAAGMAPHINRDLIQRLKERRLLQRSKSREGPSGQANPAAHASSTEAEVHTPSDTNELIRNIQERLQSRQACE